MLEARIQRCVLAGKSQNKIRFSRFSYPRLAPASSSPPEFLKKLLPEEESLGKKKKKLLEKKPWKENKGDFSPLKIGRKFIPGVLGEKSGGLRIKIIKSRNHRMGWKGI